MLDYTKLNMKNGLLLVEEHEVEIQDSINGVLLDDKTIELNKAKRNSRTGTVMIGSDDIEAGEVVLYRAEYAEPLDIPIEKMLRPVTLSAHTIISTIDG